MAYEDIDSSDQISYILLFLSIGCRTIKGDVIRMIDKSQVLKLTEPKY